MTDPRSLEPGWRTVNEHFAWAPLHPPGRPEQIDHDNAELYDLPLPIFVVRVKTNTDTGRRIHREPKAVFREVIKEAGIPEDVRVMLLRTNAEIPSNPVHKLLVFALIPDTNIVAGFEWKEPPPAE